MIRRVDYRVDVLRDGAPLCTLDMPSPPSVTAALSADIKMSMQASVRYDPRVDYARDALRLVMLIDGQAYPVGEFYVGTAPSSYSAAGVRYDSVEAYDGSYLLTLQRTETILHFDKGTRYTQIIDGLLLGAGIVRRLLSPSDAELLTDREDWDIGTPFLTIINQLLTEINYAPVRFDARGYALIQPLAEPRAANIRYRYGGRGEPLIVRPASSSVDLFGQPNVFIVTCANPDLPAPMIATAVNDNALSALSTLRTGRRIAQKYAVDNIASQADLDAYAAALRDASILRGQTVTVETQAEPGHAIGDVVAIQHDALGGIYRETAWSLTPENTMPHTLERLILA